jgi:hypothetical protein
MSSRQLDILALEPFYGGVRRAMLEAVSRCSRHRWTILKLPARRIERRLMVSAHWFAEQIARNGVGKVDVVFGSEAMNMAEFLRLRRELSHKPSVVYFHDNQLPELDREEDYECETDLVNLNSATAASEVWFNSVFNLRSFLSRASAMVARHPELQNPNPMPRLTAKAHLVPPPIDLAAMQESETGGATPLRDPRSVLFDTRGADHVVLARVVAELERLRVPMHLTLIGTIRGLPASVRPITLNEWDDARHVQALRQSGVFVTARSNAPADDLAVRALAAGCLPIVPNNGVYPELLPEGLHDRCVHDGTPGSIVGQILDAWHLELPGGWEIHRDETLAPFDAMRACRVIDERLDHLAAAAVTPSVRVTTRGRAPVGVR